MLFSCLLLADVSAGDEMGLAQGLLSGEMSKNSVILQARLTAGGRQESGEIQGAEGVGRFEISADPEFGRYIETAWLTANPDYDFILKKKVEGLEPATVYHYRLRYGQDPENTFLSPTARFQTLAGAGVAVRVTRFDR